MNPGPARALERIAPAAFVALWSTGYIGARYGLPYAGPFTFLSIRLAVATVVLALLAIACHAPQLRSRADAARAAFGGLLLHAGLLGGTFYALSRGVSTGVAAVVIGLQPLAVAALASGALGERLTRRQWIGLSMGLGGVVLVLAPGLRNATVSAAGLIACVLALSAGAVGTLWQKRHGDAIPLLWGTALQYAAAATFTGLVALSVEPHEVRWSVQFVAAVGWLVLGLSVGAILLLFWLLRRGSAAKVASLLYLVPPATALQGHVLFDERVAPIAVAGMAVALVRS
ncbi:MAG: DMT family transporter [Sporichthyaceae bacterium]